jgi:hypothetical protein
MGYSGRKGVSRVGEASTSAPPLVLQVELVVIESEKLDNAY